MFFKCGGVKFEIICCSFNPYFMQCKQSAVKYLSTHLSKYVKDQYTLKLRAMLDSKRCKYIGSLRKNIFLNDKSSKRFFTIFGEMYQPTWYKVPKLDKSVKNKLFGKKNAIYCLLLQSKNQIATKNHYASHEIPLKI